MGIPKLTNENSIKAKLYSLPTTVDQSVNVLVASGLLHKADIGTYKFNQLSQLVKQLAKDME